MRRRRHEHPCHRHRRRAARRAPHRSAGCRAWLLYAGVAAILLLSVLELVTGANDLTSSGTIAATLIATTPIMLAGLGGLWSERAGVVNIGLEGMMILGTYGAGYFGYHHGAWAGVFGAIAMGMLGGLLHAIATVIFGVDHIISGVAINIIALGAVQYLASQHLRRAARRRLHPVAQDPRRPGDHDRLAERQAREIEKDDTFFISEVAALLRALCTNLSSLVLIRSPCWCVTWYVLWRTSFGLRLRACGESPAAAESLGVHVLRYKFVAVLVSGGLAGLGGGVLAMVASSNYRDGQTGGRGYIGLAAMIFGNWRPGGLLAGSGLFGYTETLVCGKAAIRCTRCCWRWRAGAGAGGGRPAAAGAADVSASSSRGIGVVLGRRLLPHRRGPR